MVRTAAASAPAIRQGGPPWSPSSCSSQVSCSLGPARRASIKQQVRDWARVPIARARAIAALCLLTTADPDAREGVHLWCKRRHALFGSSKV